MEIITAKTAGFCFGVERAFSGTLKLSNECEGPVYTLGPVVHNEAVIRELEERGVYALSSLPGPEIGSNATIVIRAHGVTRETEEKLRKTGVNVVDLTCPFVKKIHRIVSEHSRNGETILIAGDPAHPEVQGIIGWCEGPCFTFMSEEEAKKLSFSPNTRICLVAQTTFNHEKFKKSVEIFSNLGYSLFIADTVCSATRERQEEAEKIASCVDAMIVIGSRSSSNSCKLYEICKKACNRTIFIQDADELQCCCLDGVKCVGITAGASTPNKILKEVQNYVGKF